MNMYKFFATYKLLFSSEKSLEKQFCQKWKAHKIELHTILILRKLFNQKKTILRKIEIRRK